MVSMSVGIQLVGNPLPLTTTSPSPFPLPPQPHNQWNVTLSPNTTLQAQAARQAQALFYLCLFPVLLAVFLPTSRTGRWLGIGAQATVYPALVLLEAAMHPCHSNAVYYSPTSATTITTFKFTATNSDQISKAAFYFIFLVAAIVGAHAARLVAFQNMLALRATKELLDVARRGVGGDVRGGGVGARSWSLASVEHTGEHGGGDGDGNRGGSRDGPEGGGSHRASVRTHHLFVERVGEGADEDTPESSVSAAVAATVSVTTSVAAAGGSRRREVRRAAEVGAAHVIPTAMFARPMNLLVVEDHALVRLTLATLLQQCGCNVETAKNGREGLAMMKMQRFHLTLSDIIMPVIDGIEMTRQLREWEAVHRPAWRQPLMLMSAAANNELSQRVSR